MNNCKLTVNGSRIVNFTAFCATQNQNSFVVIILYCTNHKTVKMSKIHIGYESVSSTRTVTRNTKINIHKTLLLCHSDCNTWRNWIWNKDKCSIYLTWNYVFKSFNSCTNVASFLNNKILHCTFVSAWCEIVLNLTSCRFFQSMRIPMSFRNLLLCCCICLWYNLPWKLMFDFHFSAPKDVHVVGLVWCDLKHTHTAWYFLVFSFSFWFYADLKRHFFGPIWQNVLYSDLFKGFRNKVWQVFISCLIFLKLIILTSSTRNWSQILKYSKKKFSE